MTSAKPHVCPTCQRHFAKREALAYHIRCTHANTGWVAARERKLQKRTAPPICPECGLPATMSASRYGARAECCGLRSYNFKPLVSHETLQARRSAHAAFDALWKAGEFSRGEGYRRLQVAMGMTPAECHISRMTAEAANLVVKLSEDGSLLERIDA